MLTDKGVEQINVLEQNVTINPYSWIQSLNKVNHDRDNSIVIIKSHNDQSLAGMVFNLDTVADSKHESHSWQYQL